MKRDIFKGKCVVEDEELGARLEISGELRIRNIDDNVDDFLVRFKWLGSYIGYIYGYNCTLSALRETAPDSPIIKGLDSRPVKPLISLDLPIVYVEKMNFTSDIVLTTYLERVMRFAKDMFMSFGLNYENILYGNLIGTFGSEEDFIKAEVKALWGDTLKW